MFKTVETGGGGVSYYLNIKKGMVVQEGGKNPTKVFSPEEMAGQVIDVPVKKRDKQGGGTIYYKEWPNAVGIIRRVFIKRRRHPVYGLQEDVRLLMDSGGTMIMLSFGVSGQKSHTNYFKSFASRVESMKIGEEVIIEPYDFESSPRDNPAGPKKRQIGLNISVINPDGSTRKLEYGYPWNAFGEPGVTGAGEKDWSLIEKKREERFINWINLAFPGQVAVEEDMPVQTAPTWPVPGVAGYNPTNPNEYFDGTQVQVNVNGQWVLKPAAPPTPPPMPPPPVQVAPQPIAAQPIAMQPVSQPTVQTPHAAPPPFNVQIAPAAPVSVQTAQPAPQMQPAVPVASPTACPPWAQVGVIVTNPTNPSEIWNGYQLTVWNGTEMVPKAQATPSPAPTAATWDQGANIPVDRTQFSDDNPLF